MLGTTGVTIRQQLQVWTQHYISNCKHRMHHEPTTSLAHSKHQQQV
jgi:hypothetical protein